MSEQINGHHQEEETVRFTPEQMELIQEGLDSLETGVRYTPQEVRERARKKTAAWLHANRSTAP